MQCNQRHTHGGCKMHDSRIYRYDEFSLCQDIDHFAQGIHPGNALCRNAPLSKQTLHMFSSCTIRWSATEHDTNPILLMKPLTKLNPSRLGPLSLLFHRSAWVLMKHDVWPMFDRRTATRLKMRQTPSGLDSCTLQDITVVVHLMQCVEMFHPLVIRIVTIHMGTLESNGVICTNHPRNDCIDSRPRSKV